MPGPGEKFLIFHQLLIKQSRGVMRHKGDFTCLVKYWQAIASLSLSEGLQIKVCQNVTRKNLLLLRGKSVSIKGFFHLPHDRQEGTESSCESL